MKRFCIITQEAVFGQYNASGVSIPVRLSQPNSFQPMTDPQFWEVVDGSGLAEPVLYGTETATLAGTLTTELTYSQAAFLLGWSCTRIDSTQTHPWTTSELPNDLASCTIDLAWSVFDSTTLRTKRYLGCKPGAVTISCSRDAPKLMITMAILGSTPQGNPYDSSVDPTLTPPNLCSYPTDVVTFQQSRGHANVAGSARTNFENWNIAITNTANPYFDEYRYANAIRLGSRRVNASTRFRLKSTPTDRVTYESGTAQEFDLTFTNGTHSIKFDYGPNGYIDRFKEDLPLDRENYYDWALKGMLNCTSGNILVVTVT